MGGLATLLDVDGGGLKDGPSAPAGGAIFGWDRRITEDLVLETDALLSSSSKGCGSGVGSVAAHVAATGAAAPKRGGPGMIVER